MNYITLDVAISEGPNRGYRVSVGDRDGVLDLPIRSAEFASRMRSMREAVMRSGSSLRDVDASYEKVGPVFGEEMFSALFSGEILAAFRSAEEHARNARSGLRIRLRVDVPEVASLPWEFMFDPKKGSYLTLTDRPVVRYLKSSDAARPLAPLVPPLKILCMVSAPNDQRRLNVAGERERLELALGSLIEKGLVEISWVEGGTWRALRAVIRQGWHVFHFIGHGAFDESSGNGQLIFTREDDGGTHRISSMDLGNQLSGAFDLRLVVLNACEGATSSNSDVFSSTAGHLMRNGIPAALAMQFPISDSAALEFTRVFYERAIADGESIDMALVDARNAIRMSEATASETLEWGTPVLFTKLEQGRLFELAATPRPAPVMPPKPDPARPQPLDRPVRPAHPPQPKPAAPQTQPQPAAPQTQPEAPSQPQPSAPTSNKSGRLKWIGAGAAVLLVSAFVIFELMTDSIGVFGTVPPVAYFDPEATPRTHPDLTGIFGSDASVLFDGKKGTGTPRLDAPNTWIGYEGEPAIVIVDLLRQRPVSEIQIGFLENQRFSVAGPTSILVEMADNLGNPQWTEMGSYRHPDRERDPFQYWYQEKRDVMVIRPEVPQETRALRITVRNALLGGESGHASYLEKVWVAVDEIEIR